MMFTFFDFFYYAIYKLYSGTSDNSPEFAGSCAVSGFQAFNIISIIMLYDLLIEDSHVYISKLFAGSLIIGLIIINYIRYIRTTKFSKEAIKTKWENKSLESKKKYRFLLIIYATTSTLLFFSLIFYPRSS